MHRVFESHIDNIVPSLSPPLPLAERNANHHHNNNNNNNINNNNNAPNSFHYVEMKDMEKTFCDVFHSMQFEVERRSLNDGTAAIIAYIVGNTLFVANAGDARAVLYRAGKAVALSEDHKPDNHNERLRIEEAGGFVTENNRVNGILALSRAIGDCDLQPPIICTPTITQTQLNDDDTIIIIACDGLWDMISNDHACEIAARYDSPALAAAALRDYAFSLGSTDNISVIVLFIR
jgi:serine/threonine protein phosphatase PrpC